eukprot:11239182-Alexandrium_andersonii.AAC.1
MAIAGWCNDRRGGRGAPHRAIQPTMLRCVWGWALQSRLLGRGSGSSAPPQVNIIGHVEDYCQTLALKAFFRGGICQRSIANVRVAFACVCVGGAAPFWGVAPLLVPAGGRARR